VQTTGEVTPPQAVIDACDTLVMKLEKFNNSLVAQVQMFRGGIMGGTTMGMPAAVGGMMIGESQMMH